MLGGAHSAVPKYDNNEDAAEWEKGGPNELHHEGDPGEAVYLHHKVHAYPIEVRFECLVVRRVLDGVDLSHEEDNLVVGKEDLPL